MFLFCLLGGGGALKILLVLRGGQRKNIITVEFLLSLPMYNKNTRTMRDDLTFTELSSVTDISHCLIGLLGVTELQEDEFRFGGVIQYK